MLLNLATIMLASEQVASITELGIDLVKQLPIVAAILGGIWFIWNKMLKPATEKGDERVAKASELLSHCVTIAESQERSTANVESVAKSQAVVAEQMTEALKMANQMIGRLQS